MRNRLAQCHHRCAVNTCASLHWSKPVAQLRPKSIKLKQTNFFLREYAPINQRNPQLYPFLGKYRGEGGRSPHIFSE